MFKKILLTGLLMQSIFAFDDEGFKEDNTIRVESDILSSYEKPNAKNDGIKRNDDLGQIERYQELTKEQVISLINNAYKKGFTDGAQETQIVMKRKIEKMSDYMDQLFAFHKLYLEGKLEPPKIGIVKTPVQVMNNGQTMVIEQEHLEIIERAKFVEKPKDWRNFLW